MIDLNVHPYVAGQDLLALPTGYPINEYRVERVLGCGGFGTTYLARDTHLECDVAIKEYLPRETVGRTAELSLRPHSAAAAKSYAWGLERFLLECRALASFHHPSIVRVLRYFRANETAYMVMEYVQGKPLDEWLAGRLPVSKEVLLEIVGPLLDGLETIHATGFVHRDVKPRNILIRSDGSPVLLDFGSARRVGAETDGQAMTTVVTPGFAPAEQYHTRGRQGPWTDIYAIAGVMYWMVTGCMPAEALSRLREDPMPTAIGLADGKVYGLALLQAIDWGLAPNEGDRPQRIADFRRAILGGPASDERSATTTIDAALPGGTLFADGSSLISAVLFVDLAQVEAVSEADVLGARTRIAGVISQAIATIPASKRLVVNTKEGCALCLAGDPEDALRAANWVAAWASKRRMALQAGINLGPVRVQREANGRSRILGDGITIACRVMRLSTDGEILVTRAYYELIQQLRRGADSGMRPAGRRRDARGRAYEVFAYSRETSYAEQALAPSQAATDGGESERRAGEQPPAADEATAGDPSQRLLDENRGVLARFLEQRAVRRASDREQLYRVLASLIPEPEKQAAFLASVLAEQPPTQPAGQQAQADAPSAPVTDSPPVTQSLAVVATQPQEELPAAADLPIDAPQPDRDTLPPSGELTPAVAEGDQDTEREATAEVLPQVPGSFSEEDLDHIGRLFARHIGPLAKVLLRRELSRVVRLDELCQALAKHIGSSEERRQFLEDVGVT